MATPFTVLGIVLHLTKVGESHRVVEVLTASAGRTSLIARGARASRRRFAGILDVFATLRLHVHPGRGMPTLVGADAATPRLGIRTDLDAIMRAAELCKCVRSLVPAHAAVPEIFAHLSRGLDACAAGDLLAAASVYPQLAAAAGILPEAVCWRCRTAGAPLALDPATGACICTGCAPQRTPLAPSVVAALGGAPPPDARAARDLEQYMAALVALHTDARPAPRSP